MSHELPDDVQRWPSDPFTLLGVTQDVSPPELKRAYTRLIRRYKPEHAPEQFRRIRTAYDALRRFVEGAGNHENSNGSFDIESPRQPPTDLQHSGRPRPQPEPHDDITRGPDLPSAGGGHAVSFEDRLDESWRWAVLGEELRAYQALIQLHAAVPHDQRVLARLYWLLTICPELDSARSASDWLVAGLEHTGMSGMLRELYRRELSANPGEAHARRCTDLLHRLPPSSRAADLLEWRWTALGRTAKVVEVIRADLQELRERFLAHDELLWARLVFAALDRVTFIDTPAARELVSCCERDLASLAHLQLRLSDAFDRYEMLQEMVKKRHMLLKQTTGHEELLDIIRWAWLGTVNDREPRLMAYLGTIVAQPQLALRRLDVINELAVALLLQFRDLLRSLDAISESPTNLRTPDAVAGFVLYFARHTPGDKYSDWRPQLLDFCLREVIMPEQVAAALANRIDFQFTADLHLSHALANDLPLACVCHACRLFWA